MSPTDPSRPGRATGGTLVALTVAIVLTAAMLRAPVVAVAPVARAIGDDLGVSAGIVGLLTSIPVLCFALCAPLAVAVVRRGGPNFALTVCLAGAVLGAVIRSSGGLALALVGTAVMGLFLTIGNVVVPIIISREYPPERIHLMTGVYTSSLNIGTMSVTLATAPLATGIGWRGAILVWSGFGLAALAVWIGLRGLRGAFVPVPESGVLPGGVPSTSLFRQRSTWVLSLAFAGQAFAFYGVTAWLPTLLADQGFGGTAAGAIAAIFQVSGIAGALLTPLVTTRASVLAAVVIVAVGWLAVPLGFLFAPQLWLLWCMFGGIAQGGGLTVVFIMINALGGDERMRAGRSGMVQGVGYGVAAAGPLVLGALHESTQAWTASLLTVVAAVVLFGIAGALAAAPLRRRVLA
ncbi:MAG: MFS transporter [Actinobacteria bacterium]|nr:MFS transporter [Actinomycetota bacterium]